MGVKEEVLRTLRTSSEEYISGQALADGLGVSRHAVWKAIDGLRAEGYEIEARTKRGYRLVAAADGLSAEGVAAFLPQHAPFALEYHDVIDSTNNRARQLAEDGAPAWTVVLANAQTAGRGRMGKSFYSPEASGIYMSMVVRPDCDVRDANLLTIAAAAAVAESIELVCDVKVGIKWVNDLFVEQRKVCGILTEAAVGVEEQRLRYAVVGIGINVAPPAGGYPAEIADVATSIYTQPPQTEIRNRLAAEVLRRFQPYAEALPLKAYFSSYRERLFVIGARGCAGARRSAGNGAGAGAERRRQFACAPRRRQHEGCGIGRGQPALLMRGRRSHYERKYRTCESLSRSVRLWRACPRV